MTDRLKKFLAELEAHRKPKSDDPYDNRITHCYMTYKTKDKEHRFEVRGWTAKKDMIDISAVNWTIA